jgi:hypothetical protein
VQHVQQEFARATKFMQEQAPGAEQSIDLQAVAALR